MSKRRCHSRCQEDPGGHSREFPGMVTAKALPDRAWGSPIPGAGYPTPVAGQQDLLLIPYFFPVLLLSPAAQWDAEEHGLLALCAHPQHMFPCIPCLFQPLWLCSCGHNSCKDNSCPEARFCLLIPAGCVLVCIYSQQIPPTAGSLAITKSSRAGRLCSLLHPVSLNPFPLLCSQGQFKGFHMCHLSSFMSPSDSQLHYWEFGSPVPLQPMCRKVLPITGRGFSLFLDARGDRAQA